MLVVGDAADRFRVRVQCQKAVKRRPKPVALDRQHDHRDVARGVEDVIDDGVMGKAFDCREILWRRPACLGIGRFLALIERGRIDAGSRLTGREINRKRLDVAESLLDLFGAELFIRARQPACQQNVLLLVEGGVNLLQLGKRSGRGRDQDRADHANRAGEQKSVGRVMPHNAPFSS